MARTQTNLPFMGDTTQGICWRQVYRGPVGTDVPESSILARDQLLHLISESMEARMHSFEALLQLQSTMKAIQQLRADSWPGCYGDKRDKKLF